MGGGGGGGVIGHTELILSPLPIMLAFCSKLTLTVFQLIKCANNQCGSP